MAIAVALANLAIKKSRPYDITDLGTMAFEFANDALVGIKENVAGVLNQLNPFSNLFDTAAATSEALEAYNIAKHGPNKDAYESLINISDPDLLKAYFDKEKSKLNNEQFVDPSDRLPSLAFSESSQHRQIHIEEVEKHQIDKVEVMLWRIHLILIQNRII